MFCDIALFSIEFLIVSILLVQVHAFAAMTVFAYLQICVCDVFLYYTASPHNDTLSLTDPPPIRQPGSNDLRSTDASSPNSTGGPITPRVLQEWVIAADRRMEEADRRMAAADARVVAAEERLAKLQRIVARAEVDRELLTTAIPGPELQAREQDRALTGPRDPARTFEERVHEQAATAANS